MQKYVEMELLRTKLPIISAFSPDYVKGFIFIEADKQNDVYDVIFLPYPCFIILFCWGFRKTFTTRMSACIFTIYHFIYLGVRLVTPLLLCLIPFWTMEFQACKGINTIYPSKVTLIPSKDFSRLLSVRSKCSGISKDMWARVKNGTYKGDLALVWSYSYPELHLNYPRGWGVWFFYLRYVYSYLWINLTIANLVKCFNATNRL